MLFGGGALPGPAGGAIALPIPSSRYKGEGMERRGKMVENRGGWQGGRGKKGRKMEGVLYLDICPGAREFL